MLFPLSGLAACSQDEGLIVTRRSHAGGYRISYCQIIQISKLLKSIVIELDIVNAVNTFDC